MEIMFLEMHCSQIGLDQMISSFENIRLKDLRHSGCTTITACNNSAAQTCP